jgi:hypothetical protein
MPGFNAPAQTIITATIDTYNGLGLTGSKIYTSTIMWNCTTGAVVSITNRDLTLVDSITSVDALSNLMLMLLICFAGILGALKLRR